MTTMTNFSAIAERIGKTSSEKKAVDAMANALGSVENAMTAPQTSVFIPSSAASMSFEDFIDGMYLFASKWVGEIAVDRVAIRVESLYNDITFRTMVFEYRQAVLARDVYKKRMFRSTVTGDAVCTADDWNNGFYVSRERSYSDVLYDMFVRLPREAEDERESFKKLCK